MVAEGETSTMMSIVSEIFYSPMNLTLVIVIAFLVYKIIRDRIEVPQAGMEKPAEPELPPLRRDFTVEELRGYDGTQPDGRILVAVNGSVYDVTKGKRFYGPGAPYSTFGGRDASRNLATFNVAANDKLEYDDLSDLSAMEMDSVNEWEMQFKEKYVYVGKLLRKGEEATNYEDEDDETTNITDLDSTPGTAENSQTLQSAEPIEIQTGSAGSVPSSAKTTDSSDITQSTRTTDSGDSTDQYADEAAIRKRVTGSTETDNLIK